MCESLLMIAAGQKGKLTPACIGSPIAWLGIGCYVWDGGALAVSMSSKRGSVPPSPPSPPCSKSVGLGCRYHGSSTEASNGGIGTGGGGVSAAAGIAADNRIFSASERQSVSLPWIPDRAGMAELVKSSGRAAPVSIPVLAAVTIDVPP